MPTNVTYTAHIRQTGHYILLPESHKLEQPCLCHQHFHKVLTRKPHFQWQAQFDAKRNGTINAIHFLWCDVHIFIVLRIGAHREENVKTQICVVTALDSSLTQLACITAIKTRHTYAKCIGVALHSMVRSDIDRGAASAPGRVQGPVSLALCCSAVSEASHFVC